MAKVICSLCQSHRKESGRNGVSIRFDDIKDYKLSFETLPNFSASRLIEKDEFEKLLTEII